MHTSVPLNKELDFQTIFSATASPYLILDPGLIIVEANDAYLQATGRSRDELLGKYVFEAFPDNPNDPQANGVKNLNASLQRVLQHQVTDKMAVQKYDIPLGVLISSHFTERYWMPINSPLFDRKGKLTHILHHVEDVTSQIRAEAALRESERRFRALNYATADVIYRLSPDWTHLQRLDGRGFLKDTSGLAEFHVEDYAHPEDQEMVRNAIDEAIRNKTLFELEHRIMRADGSYGWTHSRAVPLLDANGDILEWIGAASDIAGRKQAEEQLKDASRRKDEFLAMLAHELRNPLAPIRAAAELLQLAALDETRLRRTSQIIERQVAHMTHLIDDLLDVSRVTQGLVKLDSAPLDIRHVVTDAVEQVRPLIQSQRHHLELHLPPETTMVVGDKKRLVQIIANILANAAKYTPAGGKIQLKTEALTFDIHIEVIDNGVGMTPELTTRAFDLFSQGERNSDRSLGGLGLGLALVKSLGELHGGTVTCESEGLGKGSRLAITLPRLLAEGARVAALDDGTAMQRDAVSLRIMVVDDNADAAAMLAMVLEALGHEVIIEHDARRALEQARKAAPQVCLLDIGLPEIDGNELAQRLRAEVQTAHSVLIAVTGYGQERDRTRSIAAGFDHHLVKPVDTKELNHIISEIGKDRR